jgi:hypothetical protein
MARRLRMAAALLLAAASLAHAADAPACKGTIYLTFDTGSQSQADLIAATLRRHGIKATFFLANEKTVRGDWSLEATRSAATRSTTSTSSATRRAGASSSSRSSARAQASGKRGRPSSIATSCAVSTRASSN